MQCASPRRVAGRARSPREQDPRPSSTSRPRWSPPRWLPGVGTPPFGSRLEPQERRARKHPPRATPLTLRVSSRLTTSDQASPLLRAAGVRTSPSAIYELECSRKHRRGRSDVQYSSAFQHFGNALGVRTLRRHPRTGSALGTAVSRSASAPSAGLETPVFPRCPRPLQPSYEVRPLAPPPAPRARPPRRSHSRVPTYIAQWTKISPGAAQLAPAP